MSSAPRNTRKSFTEEIKAARARAAAREQGVQYVEESKESGEQSTKVPTDQAPTVQVKVDPAPIQLTPFQQRLASLRQQRETSEISLPEPTTPSASVTPVVATDVPDIGESTLSADEQMLDRLIKDLDIVDCYNRWSNKKRVNPGTKREGIMCSCPNPAHPDRRPSAWMNRDKRTWYCPGCDEGGDLWDIAAWNFGYPVPHYKTDKAMFRQLRDSIATDLGYAKYTTAGKTTYSKVEVKQPEQPAQTVPTEQPVQSDPENSDPESPDPENNVVQLFAVPDPLENEIVDGPEFQTASLEWGPLVVPNTFLDLWMQEVTKDTCPEEFHFFMGLMAVGFAVGRNRVLADVPEVIPNLNVCLVGKSGTGKSRAKYHLRSLLELAVPFDETIPFPTGTKIMNPGSGEALIREFRFEIDDPSLPTAPKKLWGIRGYVEFDEMATLIAKAGRAGSSLKPLLMELYDGPTMLANTTVTGGRVVAKQPFGQVLTTTQNRSIRHVLSAGDDAAGFVNRWTFVTGKPKPPVSINTAILNLDAAAQALKSIHVWASSKQALTFTSSAFTKFDDFILKRVIPAKDKSEDFSDIFNRMDLLLKKIIVLFACNEKTSVITDAIVDKAIHLYPYLIKVYGIVDTHMAETVAGELAELVANIINGYHKKKNAFPTAREIRQQLPPIKRDLDSLNKTLKTMVDLGIIGKEETQGKRGPKTVRYGFAV